MIKCEKAFTLIELLIIMAVLGMIAVIAIPRLSGVTNRARDAEYLSMSHIIRAGFELYYAENGEYPQSIADLDDSDNSLNTIIDSVDMTELSNIAFESYNRNDNDNDYTLLIRNTFSKTEFTITSRDVAFENY